MKAGWTQLAARFDALQGRERWLVTIALLGGIVLLAFSLLIDPALQRGRLAERLATEQRSQLANLQAQVLALQSPERDPDVAARAELAGLKQRLEAIAGRLATMEGSLVPPQRMPALLEDMVGKSGGLRLLSLKTLPVSPVLERHQDKAEALPAAEKPATVSSAPKLAADGLYKHGIEIRLEGNYQALTAYLQRLERSDMKLLWSSAALVAEDHPRLVLTLTVYTLSLDRAWLIV